MFNSKIASLEARIARLELRISKSAAITPKDPFKLYHSDPGKIDGATRLPIQTFPQIYSNLERSVKSFHANDIIELNLGQDGLYGETLYHNFQIKQSKRDQGLVYVSWNPIDGMGQREQVEVQKNLYDIAQTFKDMGI